MSTINSTIAYFGYGSLVNLGSLRTPYISAHRATLKGWQRKWLSRPAEPGSFATREGLAFLSVVKSADSEIDGMLITDHSSSLASLDKREALYSRVTIDAVDMHMHDEDLDIPERFLYVADELPIVENSGETKILRSYLDVVMQGYLNHFGVEGIKRFYATTQNFELSILEDRKQPLYPRATTLTDEEKSIFSRFR